MKPEYTKTPQGWQFHLAGDDILFQAKEIAILYRLQEDGNITIHKHGPKKTMEEELLRFQTTYMEHGLPQEANAHKIINVSDADEKELNRIIQTAAIPEKRIQDLSKGTPKSEIPPHQVPLTKDLPQPFQHLINGGKVFLDDVLTNTKKVLDLNLILKENNYDKTNPKDFSQELIVWPDGFEIPKEEFDEHPEEYSYRSDDYLTVSDIDEDLRDFLQKEIAKIIGKEGRKAKILTPTSQALSDPQAWESKALTKLPTQKYTCQTTKAEVDILRNGPATDENEAEFLNAKRDITKADTALNFPPKEEYHHIPLYRNLAQKKILSSPEPAETLNTRLKLLDLELESAKTKFRGGDISPIKNQIQNILLNEIQKPQIPQPPGPDID